MKSKLWLETNTIIQGDCFNVMDQLPPKSVDLIFADPPYNLQLKQELWRPNMTKVDAVDDEWDKFEGETSIKSFEEYDKFTERWLLAAQRIMNDNSTIWVSGTYHNIFRVGAIMQNLGFWILNTVSWFKVNAMPNFRGIRLKNDVEFVIWAKKSESSRYTFNNHLIKRYNGGKQLGSVWQIPATGGDERLKGDDGKKLHSTQKPEALLERIILTSSHPDNVVLDPFSGTGTTAAVAKRLRRQYIGVELDQTYYEASLRRLQSINPLPDGDDLIVYPQKPVKVSFESLVAAGYLKHGDLLYLDRNLECAAVILSDGQLKFDGVTGSIHSLGKLLKNAPSCNGWKHWYYQDSSGNLQVIDTLRSNYNK